MPDRDTLRDIKTFPSLVKYLRDEMDWPIEADDFEDLTFDYEPEELGIDAKTAAKIQQVKQLRPLTSGQPWGIFFVKFEPKRLPVVALRRVLRGLVVKKRASARSAEQAAWALNDLLFISNYGEGEERRITFAHFSEDTDTGDLPTLKVLGWDGEDTPLHLDDVADKLTRHLSWPADQNNAQAWRTTWASAFTLRHREVITTSKRLAERLAELARAIRRKANAALAIESENGPLRKLVKAFQQSLVHDLDADGFADMYAQTIAYGLLSARVSRQSGALVADDAALMVPVTNPFLRDLMETFLRMGGRRRSAPPAHGPSMSRAGQGSTGIDFDELGINEVVQTLRDANMEAVVLDFGDRNPQEDPVIHFYELFLKEYDAKKRLQRGVFYTPRPVVSYIVRSVHELLQTEFGLPDGLADMTTWGEMAESHPGLTIPKGVNPSERFVTILDPATGTGTFLVEAIDVIHRTLVEKWQREAHGQKKILDLWNDYVPRHLLPRLHGYELLMAPYAIAHLKIGLKLHETGYRFRSDERARIYLTNALEPAQDFSGQFESMIPALAHEAEAVNDVKRQQRFTVVIGNPPYAGISSNRGDWITGLIDCYRFVGSEPLAEKKVWLKNDYVKFLRLSQLLVETSRLGVIGLITDHSYLDSPTFRGLRHNLLGSFSDVRILNLHGNAKRRETSPDGTQDENVFDITQGVAIGIFVRCADAKRRVLCSDLWGSRSSKQDQLLGSDALRISSIAVSATPDFYRFTPTTASVAEEYATWLLVTDVFSVGSNGVQTSRDSLVLAPSQRELTERFAWIRNGSVTDDRIASICGVEDKSFWHLGDARKSLMKDEEWAKRCVPYAYRPFDNCWLYSSPAFVHRLRREVMRHMERPNIALCVGRAGLVVEGSWDLLFCTKGVCDHNLFYRGSSLNFPLHLDHGGGDLLNVAGSHSVAKRFAVELARNLDLDFDAAMGLPKSIAPEDAFHYSYAVFHSPGYRTRYAEFLKIDFPRLPLTSSLDLFHEMARLGGELVALHLVEAPAQQALSARYDQAANAWRYEVANGQRLPITLSFNGPEKPVVGKVGWSDDTVWLDAAATKKGYPATPGTIGFHGVPEEVWSFHIGGYQVCEKWLKDRKGRTLTADDIAHYHRIVIALHETIRLMREIDEVIEAHGGWPTAFATKPCPPPTALPAKP